MENKPDFKINNFDLLRLLAAIEVIFDHYFQHLHIPLSAFQTTLLYLFPGVPVFFIISGYLISASFERNNNLIDYSRNRALRIFPGLWGCVLVTVVVISITGVNFLNKQTLAWLPAQLAGFIYTPGFLSNYGFGSYNGSLWTIPIELQFYISIPILYLLVPKRYFTVVIVVLLGVFLALNVVYNTIPLSTQLGKLVDYTFMPHFYLFLLGILLQRLKLYKSKLISGAALLWLAVYISFCLGTYSFLPPLVFELTRNLLLGFVVLALAYSWPQVAARILRGNDISYGVYMYHGLILTVLIQEKWTEYINVYLLVLITFIAAYLSWIGIERVFIRKKIRSLRGKPANIA